MGSIGYGEVLLIFIIALLLFGPEKLPELGKALGRAFKEFKKAENEVREILKEENDSQKKELFEEKEEEIKNLKKDE
jgi:sec-independent protein translocase protein TatA